MPTLVGVFSANMKLAAAMGLCACSAYILIVLAAFLLPETRGRDLRMVGTEAKASANA
jgi:hypothetical protein